MRLAPLAPILCALIAMASSCPPLCAAPRAKAAQAPGKVDPAPIRVDPAPAKVDEADARYQSLASKYAAAEKAYFVALDLARKQGQTAVQSGLVHPIAEYFARFEALVAEGDGHALLWTALRVEAAHPEREKPANAKDTLALLTRVTLEHASAPWLKELVVALSAAYVALPPAELDTLVETLVQKCPDRELAAEALYRAGAAWKRSKADGAAERSKFFLDRVTKDFADTNFGKGHGGEGTATVGLTIGKLAPDFTAKDADGVEFKLSDYRGKVVVLDFWGFW